ncbi:hypothetical protein [Fundicoccus ignavus]|uniref:Zinc ribbon domain-containing protein n=1 Tax=Fundicoccus ignavus TaxID=2664442 RepID=A0A844C2I7_9LACT|nr:hypothetical protein [Fundicoccus ignavus]MRJ48429.1 hypothetical protein [Fundicoccus ignavus]
MNFCTQCGFSLKGIQGGCPNCGQVIEEIELEAVKPAENSHKVADFDYQKILNLINLLQHNFYLVFILTMLLFITISFSTQTGWLLLSLSLLGAYLFANYKTSQSLELNQKIETWFIHQVIMVPEKLKELDSYTQQISEETRELYHSVKTKAHTQVENIKDNYQQSSLGVSKAHKLPSVDQAILDEKNQLSSAQLANDTGSLRRRRRLQAQARKTQQIKQQQVESSEGNTSALIHASDKTSTLSFIMWILLTALALFIYYSGINNYSLFDVNASVLWNSYQQTTFTMSEVIVALGYGALFDNSGQSEFYQMIFTIIAYYLPVVFAVLSFLRSKFSGFIQFIISVIMGGGMTYLIYLAIDSNLFIRYNNDYGSVSTELGLGSQMILGSIILLLLCSLFKMFKGK